MTPPDAAFTVSQLNEKKLVALIRSLEMPVSFERSFRLSSSGISADRFLISTANKRLDSNYKSECKAVFKEFGCPEAVSDVIDNGLAEASDLHWGIDRGARSTFRKIYFEYPVGRSHDGSSATHSNE